MKRHLICLAVSVASAAAAPVCQELEVIEGLRPFRHPTEVVEVPRELFDKIQVMVNTIEDPEGYEVYVDETGREVCEHPAWLAARERLSSEIHLLANRFGLVLRDSKLVNDRKLAAYGTFLLDDPQQVFELIAFLPGEPLREIREPAMRRAIHFLRVHHPTDIEIEGTFQPLYQLNVGPYLAMLALEDPIDQAQALWFLKEVMTIRPDSGLTILLYGKKYLGELLVSEHDDVREQARGFLYRADPEHRRQPDPDATDEQLLAWMDGIVYEYFPPIRPVSDGRTDLYPSDDLDRVVEVGRESLRQSSIGAPHHGVLDKGGHYRGFRVARLPDPLDKLRIPLDAVITNVNGLPVASGPEILAALEAWPARSSLFVEYVYEGSRSVMEYRLRK